MYPAVSEKSCTKNLKQVLLHMGTPCYCLLHLEVGGVIQTKHPKGVLHRGMSPHRDEQKLLLLGDVMQVPHLKRHPLLYQAVGGAVSVWPIEVFL